MVLVIEGEEYWSKVLQMEGEEFWSKVLEMEGEEDWSKVLEMEGEEDWSKVLQHTATPVTSPCYIRITSVHPATMRLGCNMRLLLSRITDICIFILCLYR